MHRSGTSATAHTLVELGLSTPDPGDLIQPGPQNERGYWESQTVARFDESVLRHLGGTWSAPPSPAAGWEGADDAGMRALRARATELAASVFGPPARRHEGSPPLRDAPALADRPAHRSRRGARVPRPDGGRTFLQQRDGFPLTLGLALWHRYVRQSLVSVDRLPVLVVDYGRSLEEPPSDGGRPDDVPDRTRHHAGSGPIELAAQVLFSATCSTTARGARTTTLVKDLQPLLDVLRDRLGVHGAWSIARASPRARVGGGRHQIDVGWSGGDRGDAERPARAQVGQEVAPLPGDPRPLAGDGQGASAQPVEERTLDDGSRVERRRLSSGRLRLALHGQVTGSRGRCTDFVVRPSPGFGHIEHEPNPACTRTPCPSSSCSPS